MGISKANLIDSNLAKITPRFDILSLLVAIVVAAQAVMFYGVRWLIKQMDPMRKKKDEAAVQAKSTFARLGVYLSLDVKIDKLFSLIRVN